MCQKKHGTSRAATAGPGPEEESDGAAEEPGSPPSAFSEDEREPPPPSSFGPRPLGSSPYVRPCATSDLLEVFPLEVVFLIEMCLPVQSLIGK